MLRPGGYFVWSATPVYQNKTEDVEIWEGMRGKLKLILCPFIFIITYIKYLEFVKHLPPSFCAAMKKLTKAMCWELVVINNDKLNQVGAAIYRKPTNNECYENRQQNEPPLCESKDDPDAVW